MDKTTIEMNDKEIIAVDDAALKAIIDHYGPEAQTIQAIEELAELQQELAKYLNGKGNLVKLAEEVADALIMISQVTEIYHIDESTINTTIEYKLNRQLVRIEQEGSHE